MPRYVRPSSNNENALIVIFDIISRIIFIYAAIVLIYWLFTQFVVAMGVRIPGVISAFCEFPYGLSHIVGYSHHGGFNFAGGIAALIMFIIGYIFELIRNALIKRY